eukprot:TRINITY_DN7409_c0_g1_i1.p1 TRINITY_DN7409_c0_g1~~TRINITY_DN7409_c0_g1_i1.p1  ORF type:complete len:165 (-),score=42.41 TRINITY_DN7409_c0_g1_i1:26-520(-)
MLITTHPAQEFGASRLGITLTEAQLSPRATVILKPVDKAIMGKNGGQKGSARSGSSSSGSGGGGGGGGGGGVLGTARNWMSLLNPVQLITPFLATDETTQQQQQQQRVPPPQQQQQQRANRRAGGVHRLQDYHDDEGEEAGSTAGGDGNGTRKRTYNGNSTVQE